MGNIRDRKAKDFELIAIQTLNLLFKSPLNLITIVKFSLYFIFTGNCVPK